MAFNRISHMEYLDGMEVIDSDIMDKVLKHLREYDYRQYTGQDVQRALVKEQFSIGDYAVVLSPAALPYLEDMARKAMWETRKHFGNSVCLFTPCISQTTVKTSVSIVVLIVKIKFAGENLLLKNWKESSKPSRQPGCKTS